jgi:hypothetical protein
MRIGTWNVEYATSDRLDVLRRVLTKYPADIWVLTETHDDFVPPGLKYFAHSLPRPKTRAGSRWVSVWSRYPIIECPTLSGMDRRRTVAAVLEVDAKRKLLVYGTVMPWHSDQGDDPPPAKLPNWSEHHRVLPQQCREWASLQRLYPDASLCVAGDYNTDMGRGARYGTREGIASLIVGLAECELFCATAPGRVSENLLPVLPIDHISLPLTWAKSASVVAAWPAFKGITSDHSGLVVEVDFSLSK